MVDETENNNGQVERCHGSRYRQILVRLQKLNVAVTGRHGPPARSL